MLSQISVQGFKSLQSVRGLELGQVNVFVGANGSGKSNFLEALGFIGAAANGQLDDLALSRRGVRLSVPSLYLPSFKSLEAQSKIKISAVYTLGPDIAEYEIEVDGAAVREDRGWVYQQKYKLNGRELTSESLKSDFPSLYEEMALEFSKEWKSPVKVPWPKFLKLPVFQGLFSLLPNYAIYAPATRILRGVEPDSTQRSPVGLGGGRLPEAIADLLDVEQGVFGSLDLDDLFELLDWVEEIAVVRPSDEIVSPGVPTIRNIVRFTDRWMAKGRNRLSAYDASEGALYVLFSLVLGLHPGVPRLFAIENLDQAMHPRLARATVRLFSKQILKADPSRQVLLTTHSPLVLDGLDLRDDRVRLFAVERGPQGATRIERVEISNKILQKIENGLSISNLWVNGFLGGVPDIF